MGPHEQAGAREAGVDEGLACTQEERNQEGSTPKRSSRSLLLVSEEICESAYCVGSSQAMQARFDFAGALIPPTEDLPTHLGLHHHGEEPEVSRPHCCISPLMSFMSELKPLHPSIVMIFVSYFINTEAFSQRAGYSLQELFLLSRSQVIQQRSLALSTLANILSKVNE